MTSIVSDFKSIRRKLEKQEQKAEFEEKNPPVDLGMYGYPSNLTVPFVAEIIEADKAEPEAVFRSMSELMAWLGDDVAARWTGL